MFCTSFQQNAYNSKLWAGDCFKFDSSERGEKVVLEPKILSFAKYHLFNQKVIMADQLAGYWYRKIARKRGLIEKDKVYFS